MRIKIVKSITVAIVILSVVACASKRHGSETYGGGDASAVNDMVRFYGADLSPEQERAALNKNTYYFGYDRFDISDEDIISIYAHAKKLITRPNTFVRIEGHTDERGSREYNVVLAERRAKTIANILILKGVSQDKIAIVGYGKEKPAVLGHDESAWAQNRRAVIIYEAE